MKAVVIHPYMSVLGGGERVCLHIVRALLEEGHDVTLISEPIDENVLEKSLGSSILGNAVRIPYHTFIPKFRKFSVYQRLLHHNAMKRRVKKKIGTADLEILTQDVMFLCDVGKKKAAYVHYPEYLVHLEGVGSKSEWFWRTYYAPVLWYWHQQIGKIDLFLCNSEYTKKAIREKWGKDAEVVYPPVDVEKIKPEPKEAIVATVGRFVKEKNFEMVIEVAKLIPDVKFVIMGRKQDKEYYEEIRRAKPDNITLLTDLSHEELFSVLSRARVYLHTMIGEHFGISIVEAMAAGCVPIVHNSGGARDIIRDIGYAYNNIKECGGYISEALSKDIDMPKMVESAKRFESENFRGQIKKVLRERGFM